MQGQEQVKMDTGKSKKAKSKKGTKRKAEGEADGQPKSKKPLTAYVLFSKDMRSKLPKVKEDGTPYTFSEHSEMVGNMWNKASPQEKEPFEKLYRDNKKAWQEANGYKPKVKGPPNGRSSFMMKMRLELQGIHGNTKTPAQISEIVKKAWTDLPKEQQEVYRAEARAARKLFEVTHPKAARKPRDPNAPPRKSKKKDQAHVAVPGPLPLSVAA